MLHIQDIKGVTKNNNQVVQQTIPQAVCYCPPGDRDSSPHDITQVMIFLLVSRVSDFCN